MISPMHTDFLSFLPVVIDRLNEVKAIKKVFTAKELSDLDTGKLIAPQDGCAYVILDSYAPAGEAGSGKNQTIDVLFSVLLAKQHYSRSDVGDVGVSLTAIMKALVGFDPMLGGKNLTTLPIYLDKGANVLYQKGFALYPLRFKTQVAIVAD